MPSSLSQLSKLQGLFLQSNRLACPLAELRETVIRHLPLSEGLGLGANRLGLTAAFELPGVRLGLAWNLGAPPAHLAERLTDHFGTTDHVFDPLVRGGRAALLLVAFAAQGAGMQQWAAPCAAARAAGVPLDALYLADPSNSYYTQDPRGSWDGVEYYTSIIREHTRHYGGRVLVLGSSMGGTAALMHAALGCRALSFGPRVDLRRTHGAYLPQVAKRACAQAIERSVGQIGARLAPAEEGFAHRGLTTRPAQLSVHVGSGNAVDVAQAALLAGAAGVEIVQHDTFHHNVPMYLEREGLLIGLIKSACAELLLDAA